MWRKGETQCCYQALHHQFVAAILLRKIVPDAKIGSMITKLMTYPYTCAPEDVAATQLTVGLRITLIELYDRYRLAVDLPEERCHALCKVSRKNRKISYLYHALQTR